MKCTTCGHDICDRCWKNRATAFAEARAEGAAEEREACARECEGAATFDSAVDPANRAAYLDGYVAGCERSAARIRARSAPRDDKTPPGSPAGASSNAHCASSDAITTTGERGARLWRVRFISFEPDGEKRRCTTWIPLRNPEVAKLISAGLPGLDTAWEHCVEVDPTTGVAIGAAPHDDQRGGVGEAKPRTCQWNNEAEKGEVWETCSEPATHTACVPFQGAVVCAAHKCRCSKPLTAERVVQVGCDRCTRGVMDQGNPHLHGLCRYECHAEERRGG